MSRTAEAPPRGLDGLLRWFLAAWAEEVPDRLHTTGVWRDWGVDSVGGSRLGTPRTHDGFRAYIEGSPYETDHDVRLDPDERGAVYVRPVHAALARMVGPNGGGPLTPKLGVWPFMGRFLFALACSGGDWRGTALRWGIPPQAAPLYAEKALERLWGRYEREPEARAVA